MVDKIKVGHKIYKVIEDDLLADDSGRVGEINCYRTEIKILPRLDGQSMAETLVHEAVHGMLDFIGERGKSEDEATVDRITNGTLMLIRDNPELFLRFTRDEDEKGNLN